MVRSFSIMDVVKAINRRRAYRSFKPVKITKELIEDLASCAQIAASCFNNQPWRYIFVYNKEMLEKMHSALSEGNKWAYKASMIIVVLGKKDDDCVIYDRIYYRFDIGMATAHIILRATELGLVAHPIAGYSPTKTREILGIPDEIDVISLVIVGKHSEEIDPVLSEKQRKEEKERPKRKSIDEFVYINRYIEKK
jgi:nitroreductase